MIEDDHGTCPDNPWIETYPSGERFCINSPDVDKIHLEDIANSLSMTCRFVGHVRKFYSVAEHSVLASWVIRNRGGSLMEQCRALFHDGSEAYLGDVSRPLKILLSEYTLLESPMQDAVYDRFGIPKATEEEYGRLKDIDAALLKEESTYLQPSRGSNYSHWDLEPTGMRIRCYQPDKAIRIFTSHAELLFRQLKEGGND